MVPEQCDRIWEAPTIDPIHFHAFLDPRAIPLTGDPRDDYHLPPVTWCALALRNRGHNVTMGTKPPERYDVAILSDVGSRGQPDGKHPVLYQLDDDCLTPRGHVLPKEWVIIADNRWSYDRLSKLGRRAHLAYPGFDPGVFKPLGYPRVIPVGFRGRRGEGPYYQGRERVLAAMEKFPGASIVATGNTINSPQDGLQLDYAGLNWIRNRMRVYILHAYDNEDGFSPHLPEALGAGCIVVHNETPGVRERFPFVPTYRTVEEAVELVRGFTSGDLSWHGASHAELVEGGHSWDSWAKVAIAAASKEGIA